ncbi:MAG: tRNA-dihydrouridine synthase family protein [Planctomycetes bacterium]|nr:tRNA-dihydrouridine synthase family protein [Planctomycetota bacterium]
MRPISIGNVRIAHPFVQAALSGYSDLPMRRIARKYGAAYSLNEVVLDKSVLQKGKGQKRILTNVEEQDQPVGGQLMGSDPNDFAPAARMLADTGYNVIDINFGCPVRKVLGRCRGGFLLSQPTQALDIVKRVLDAVGSDIPVTVKMRRGLDDSCESERNFFAILDGALEAGISGVTVHGRTVSQRYVGPSKWAFLTRVKRHIGNALMFGSGDLFTAKACLDMMTETGVDGVTIARGAIGNPWIFRDCIALANNEPLPPPPSIIEQRACITSHFAESRNHHGDAIAGRLMRKFGIKYSELHPLKLEVRGAFIAVKTPDEFQDVLDRWYDPNQSYPPVIRHDGTGDLVAAGASITSREAAG